MRLAKYIRLSSADEDIEEGGKAESDSVANQRALLDRYIGSCPGLRGAETLEFVDDGRSGTNFDRPGFQALMELARRGGIDCVLVKDLSRLGRDYIEAGGYLERVFPSLGVRFISVNDGYDSERRGYGAAGDLDTGLRNLINDMYSRDLSQRVRTARTQYARRGESVEAFPIFGYRKAPENRRKWIVDPPAADTVRLIFRLALEGKSVKTIAEELNRMGRAVPSQRKKELNIRHQSWNRLRNDPPWTKETVRRILRDERYTGKLISFQRTRREVGSPDTIALPREDWIVVENAFEAIVPEEIFHKAQALFPPRPCREYQKRAPALFSPHCGLCGLAVAYVRTARPHFRCDNCKKMGRLYEDDLTKAVLAALRRQLDLCGLRDGARREKPEKRETARQQGRIRKLRGQKCRAFMERCAGSLSAAEYDAVCREIDERIAALRGSVRKADRAECAPPSLEDPGRSVHGAEVRKMAEKLIADIIIYPENRVELVWAFDSKSIYR